MRSRFRWLGTALLAGGAFAAIVLLVVFRVVGPSRWPENAIYVPRDVPTIQQALETAGPGTTIVLQSQGEPFRGPLTVDKANVTVASSSSRTRLVAAGSEPAIRIRADGVVVDGLEITAESVGLRVEAARCTIDKTRVLDTPIGVQLHEARECELVEVEVDGGRIGLELVSSRGNDLIDIVVKDASEYGLRIVGSANNRLEGVTVGDVPIAVSLGQGSSGNELRGLLIEGAAIAGIELHQSNDNFVVDSVLHGSGTGLVLEGVTGNEVRGCEIIASSTTGLVLRQAIQNRATENRIEGSGDVGIHLAQGAENALSYNAVRGCGEAGIRIDESDRNLIIGNTLTESALGIASNGSSDGRILRNTILSVEPSGIGMCFVGGSENRILDNHVRGGKSGLLISGSSGNRILRNRIEDQAVVGLSLVDGSSATSAAENRIVGNVVGIAIAASDRGEVLNNRVSENDTAVLLVRPGSGIRIDGNAIEGNRIGIHQTDASEIVGTEGDPGNGAEVAAAIVVNNLFVGNESLDVLNDTSIPFYAGGNWWGETGDRDTAAARVSDGVLLGDSAWRGTIAIGTGSDVSDEILGRLLQYALIGQGFRVIDLIGMGGSERVREALRMQDVDFIWWGTSAALLPEANAIGVHTMPIPAMRRWTVVVSEETAAQLAEPTVSALSAWIRRSDTTFRYAAPQSLGHAAAGTFEELYGLREWVASVSWAESLEEAEALLKFGAVEMAIADNLEETLTSSGFVSLEDDLAGFETAEILIAFKRGLLARFPEIEDVVQELTPALTTSAIHDLIGRTRLLQRDPEAVAWEFLVQLGILLE